MDTSHPHCPACSLSPLGSLPSATLGFLSGPSSSCLQGHSSYNGLLSAVLLASDFSEGLGSHSIFSPGPALLSCQFLSCFSVLLFPLHLCCALLLLFTGVVFSALNGGVATALNASWSPQQTVLFRCVTLEKREFGVIHSGFYCKGQCLGSKSNF